MKDEKNTLKEENEELKTKILSKQKKLKDEITKFKKELKEEEDIEGLKEENKQLIWHYAGVQDIYDGMTQNLILSLISTPNDEMEFKLKSEYTKYCTDENYKQMHKYIQDKIKEMNDTDWNDDGGVSKLEYDDNYTISVVFNDDDDDE